MFGRRPVATRRCEPVTSVAAAADLERDRDPAAPALDPRRIGVGQDADAFVLQDLADRLRDVRVLARDQPLVALDDGHLAAEAPVHLAELQADVAAAEDHQVRGQEVDGHHRGVVEIGHGIDAGERRDVGATADVDEDLVGREPLVADRHLLRPDEAGVTHVDGDAVGLAQPFLDSLVGDLDDRVLARLDRLHVDPDRALDDDAEVRGPARDVRGAGARDQGLGRDAAVVDAGAAEALALDDRDAPAGLRQAVRQGPARTGRCRSRWHRSCGHVFTSSSAFALRSRG